MQGAGVHTAQQSNSPITDYQRHNGNCTSTLSYLMPAKKVIMYKTA